MEARKPSYFRLLELLCEHGVDFIVVGGVAAILEGAPITTLDLDVVYGRSPDNIERLLKVLQSIKARYRDPAGRHIEPTPEKLSSVRMNLLATDLGAFDALSEIAGSDYEALLRESSVRKVGDLNIHVLGLAKLIESKEIANRDKDRAVLPILRKLLELQLERDR